MGRRKAREAAFMVLFELDFGQAEVEAVFARAMAERGVEGPDRDFARDMVWGTLRYRERIDAIIKELSRDWRIERMNSVDRNVMRLALYELLYREDIPPNVAINEAVELVKRYGGADSPRFVNGILGKVAENLAAYRAAGG